MAKQKATPGSKSSTKRAHKKAVNARRKTKWEEKRAEGKKTDLKPFRDALDRVNQQYINTSDERLVAKHNRIKKQLADYVEKRKIEHAAKQERVRVRHNQTRVLQMKRMLETKLDRPITLPNEVYAAMFKYL